ncbi:MAG: NusG domain II-containing protein [Desulfuromonadales bacterium]|nr:NusG domain II-containing protein [Desulfuromonadales bacterium]
MTRADKVLIAAVLLCALLGLLTIYRHFFISSDQPFPKQATITVDGKVLRTIDLDPVAGNEMIQITGRLGPATVEVAGGRIRMREANCPEQICVKQGWIQAPGSTIVCLPGEIIIHIEGPAPVDAVTR